MCVLDRRYVLDLMHGRSPMNGGGGEVRQPSQALHFENQVAVRWWIQAKAGPCGTSHAGKGGVPCINAHRGPDMKTCIGHTNH